MHFKKRNKKQDTPIQNVTQIQNDYTNIQLLMKKMTLDTQKKARRRMVALLMGGALILVPMAKDVVDNLFDIQTIETDIADAQDKKKALTSENQDLKVEIGLLQDEDYVAKLARSRYYLSKDNEIIFSLPEDNLSKEAEKEKQSKEVAE